MRSKLLVLEQALTVLVRDHHQRLLAPPFAHIDFLDEQLDTLSADITCLRTDLSILPPTVPPAPVVGGANEGTAQPRQRPPILP